MWTQNRIESMLRIRTEEGYIMIWYMICMSVALSVDALGIGISYRMNGVQIPIRTKMIIGVITTVIMVLALGMGTLFHHILPDQVSKWSGAGALILVGILLIRNTFHNKGEVTYDFDRSRTIEPLEGILLAIALSTDSIGAGVAVASAGVNSCFFGLLVGFMQLFFLFLADYLVTCIPNIQKCNKTFCGILSGLLLIFIGGVRLIR